MARANLWCHEHGEDGDFLCRTSSLWLAASVLMSSWFHEEFSNFHIFHTHMHKPFASLKVQSHLMHHAAMWRLAVCCGMLLRKRCNMQLSASGVNEPLPLSLHLQLHVFTARRYAKAVYVMAQCPCVCLSQIRVLLKRVPWTSHDSLGSLVFWSQRHW